MMGFFFSHLGFPVGLGAVLLVVVVLLVLGGLPLLLHRWVIGAILLALTALGLSAAWIAHEESLRAEGAAALQAVNNAATAQRRSDISEFVVSLSARNAETGKKLDATLAQLESARLELERESHVTAKANAGCTLTVGFVRDYNQTLPRADGPSPVPDGGTDLDRAAGIPLSNASVEIGRNNATCAAAVERYRYCEQTRYDTCLAWDRKFGTRSNCAR